MTYKQLKEQIKTKDRLLNNHTGRIRYLEARLKDNDEYLFRQTQVKYSREKYLEKQLLIYKIGFGIALVCGFGLGFFIGGVIK